LQLKKLQSKGKYTFLGLKTVSNLIKK
jgi:hypothetical protein